MRSSDEPLSGLEVGDIRSMRRRKMIMFIPPVAAGATNAAAVTGGICCCGDPSDSSSGPAPNQTESTPAAPESPSIRPHCLR